MEELKQKPHSTITPLNSEKPSNSQYCKSAIKRIMRLPPIPSVLPLCEQLHDYTSAVATSLLVELLSTYCRAGQLDTENTSTILQFWHNTRVKRRDCHVINAYTAFA